MVVVRECVICEWIKMMKKLWLDFEVKRLKCMWELGWLGVVWEES